MDRAHDQLATRNDKGAEKAPSLAERLKACGRMTPADKRVCSMNLGRLAERIRPDSPLAGARAIFEEAREDFSKRQRWITLAGEEPTETIGSTGATWLTLARASGRLLGAGANIEASQDRAIQQLLRGTSFLPVYVPEGREQASRKALADEYAKRVSALVTDDGSLERLWQVLQEFPFAVETKHSDEKPNSDDLVPVDWVDVQYPNSRPFAFATSSDGLTSWSWPRVDIGCIAFKHQTSVFVLPKQIAKAFRLRCENDESCLPETVIEMLISAGITLKAPWSYCNLNDLLPDDPYDSERGWGWKYTTAVDFVRVRLKIVPNDEGRPRLVADFFAGDESAIVDIPGMSAGPSGWSMSAIGEQWVQEQAFNRNYSRTFRSIRTAFIGSDEMMARLVFAEPQDTYGGEDPVPIGLMDAEYPWVFPDHFEQDTDTTLDWCDTADWAKTMLTADYKFVPNFEISNRETPFPKGSVMNALFSNLQIDDPTKRVDRLLRAHSARTAEIGLAWYGRLVDEARDALERMR